MTIKFGSIFPVKEKDSANTMRAVAEPISDSERREEYEKKLQEWFDRTLEQLVQLAWTDKNRAKKFCKEATDLAYGDRELSKIIKQKATAGSGRYPTEPPYWNHLILIHYAIYLLESKHDSYSKKNREAIQRLIEFYRQGHNHTNAIQHSTMNDKISNAIKTENLDECPDLVHKAIKLRQQHAPRKRCS